MSKGNKEKYIGHYGATLERCKGVTVYIWHLPVLRYILPTIVAKFLVTHYHQKTIAYKILLNSETAAKQLLPLSYTKVNDVCV